MKKETSGKGISHFGGSLPVFNGYACGIDIGDTFHCVAVNNGKGGHDVLTVDAFTEDLDQIVAFLQARGVTSAAMESTGIYWLPLHLKLESAGIDCYLVNAKHVKNVTGRKKDDTDAIWLQKLHTCGLLQKSFQPDSETRLLRTYVRQRHDLVCLNSDEVNRMQKALELMNIKVHTVISDILGKSGWAIVKAILAGERDGEALYALCDGRLKASKEDILKSLAGIWSDEYLFLLSQAVAVYEFRQGQIKACEAKIQAQLLKQAAIVQQGDITDLSAAVVAAVVAIEAPTPALMFYQTGQKKGQAKPVKGTQKVKAPKKPKKNQFDASLSPYLKALTGVDLCKIPGIGEVTALELIAEIGTDMSKWQGEKRFAAWLNLVPNTKVTGGKTISNKMMKKKNKAGQCLKQAAFGLANSKSPLGAYYRKIKAKLGGKGAVVATAHKLARIIYTMLSKKVEFNPAFMQDKQEKSKEEKIKKLQNQIEKLQQAA